MQIQLPPIPPVRVTFVTQGRYWWAQWDFWVSVFTFALAVMTGLLALETRGLRSDSSKTIKASEDAAKASAETAKAAAKSAAIAQESMQRSLRAYVTLQQIDLLEQDGLKIPNRVNVHFINTGQTPARKLELFYEFKVRDNWPTVGSDAIGGTTLMQADVGKDQSRKFYAEYFRSSPETTAVKDGAKFLMLYGAAKYMDMFSEEPRYTYFSYAWDATRQMFYPFGPLNSVS